MSRSKALKISSPSRRPERGGLFAYLIQSASERASRKERVIASYDLIRAFFFGSSISDTEICARNKDHWQNTGLPWEPLGSITGTVIDQLSVDNKIILKHADSPVSQSAHSALICIVRAPTWLRKGSCAVLQITQRLLSFCRSLRSQRKL